MPNMGLELTILSQPGAPRSSPLALWGFCLQAALSSPAHLDLSPGFLTKAPGDPEVAGLTSPTCPTTELQPWSPCQRCVHPGSPTEGGISSLHWGRGASVLVCCQFLSCLRHPGYPVLLGGQGQDAEDGALPPALPALPEECADLKIQSPG